jgi:chromosome segregation ATPase
MVALSREHGSFGGNHFQTVLTTLQDKSALSTKLADLDSQHQAVVATQAELTTKLQSATTDLESAKKERDEATSKIPALEEFKTKSSTDLEAAQKERDDAVSKISALEEFKTKSEQAAAERDEALSKAQALETELAALKDLQKKFEASVPAVAEPIAA